MLAKLLGLKAEGEYEAYLKYFNEVLDEEVRPFVALDGGGVDVISIQGNEVTISYSGNCVGCFSSTGSTLSFIQEILREKLTPSLQIIPIL